MTSLPSPTDDYAAPPDMRLSKEAWDAALTSIGARLRSLEAVEADLQAVIDGLTTQALDTIAANVAPQIATIRETIVDLGNDIALAEAAVAQLIATTLPASNIVFTPANGVAAVNVQGAIAELASDVTALNAGVAGATSRSLSYALALG